MRDITTPGNADKHEDWAYKSTYSNSYMGNFGPPAPNGRVRTSQFYPSGRPAFGSIYQTDFLNFPVNKREVVPYGSSSGYRKNNPHPHNMQAAFKHPSKDYYVWSPYRRLPPLASTTETTLNSHMLLQQVCQDKSRSIYQQDFKQPPYATDFMSRPTSTRIPSASGVPQRSSMGLQSQSNDKYTELMS